MEYEVDDPLVHKFSLNGVQTTWPTNYQVFHQSACQYPTCVQGDLYKRKTTSGSTIAYHNAEDILQEYERTKDDNLLYVTDSTALGMLYTMKTSNVLNFIDSIFTFNQLRYPPVRPDAYSAMSFTNTQSFGGYGAATQGSYTAAVHANTKSGFKPFGTLGQGPNNTMSAAFDTSAKPRVMLLTLMPQPTYNQGNDVIKIEVGSYPWSSHLFSAPPQAPAYSEEGGLLGALYLQQGFLLLISMAIFTL